MPLPSYHSYLLPNMGSNTISIICPPSLKIKFNSLGRQTSEIFVRATWSAHLVIKVGNRKTSSYADWYNQIVFCNESWIKWVMLKPTLLLALYDTCCKQNFSLMLDINPFNMVHGNFLGIPELLFPNLLLNSKHFMACVTCIQIL
jgi:hypothetical protein